jgi:hypothetical protein
LTENINNIGNSAEVLQYSSKEDFVQVGRSKCMNMTHNQNLKVVMICNKPDEDI